MNEEKKHKSISELYESAKATILKNWDYCAGGVWQDTRTTWWISTVKVLNLTVRGFFNGDLQSKACAMTFRTLLAIVPLLALLFAIGRGFGLGDYLQQQILAYFPAQTEMLNKAFGFVDAYLAQASQGIFVGVGIIFLLYTLVSLLGSVEDVFNTIWNVSTQRSMFRKIIDYTAILLFLPILMIVLGGISIFMSTTVRELFDFGFLSPLLSWGLDMTSFVLTWLMFALCYALIPNAKVNFGKAFIAGIFAGTGFQILQWLFVTGQMYVAKYNAIYGSFSFLPLFLIWMQLVWLITFVGASLCYSSQNIFRHSFEDQIANISSSYRMKVTLAILTVIVQRFKTGAQPVTAEDIVKEYALPPQLVDESIAMLIKAGLVCNVVSGNDTCDSTVNLPCQLTHDTSVYTIGYVSRQLDNQGASDFIPGFAERFESVSDMVESIESTLVKDCENKPLSEIVIH
ncbi:MAG: YihY/virulence factor BrkB family protein [Muribaculaceae bacterium]|nr:YihY/virulence factor BrkB family protein [Muribaculaceae bacterium]